MINFMRRKWLYFLISAAVIVPGVLSLVFFGLNPSIDFTGGTLWELRFEKTVESTRNSVLEVLESQGFTSVVQVSGENQLLVKTSPLDSEEHDLLADVLETDIGKFEEIRFETLGPKLGGELLKKALYAVLIAIFCNSFLCCLPL